MPPSLRQVGGKLLVATTGGSPLKPSEVALLEVADVAALKASGPGDWQTLQRSSTAEVRRAGGSAADSATCLQVCRSGF